MGQPVQAAPSPVAQPEHTNGTLGSYEVGPLSVLSALLSAHHVAMSCHINIARHATCAPVGFKGAEINQQSPPNKSTKPSFVQHDTRSLLIGKSGHYSLLISKSVAGPGSVEGGCQPVLALSAQ